MGLLPENSLLPVTSNRNMLAQALKARQQPRNQLTGQGLLDTAAIGLSPVPVIGDAIGLAADASRFYNEPESRTPLNFGLAALGAIPFIPPLVSMGLGKIAQSQGKTLTAPSMSGPAKNQAGAIVYHGSPHKFDQFDSSKIGTGEGAQAYGHGLYFAENPEVAKSYVSNVSQFDRKLNYKDNKNISQSELMQLVHKEYPDWLDGVTPSGSVVSSVLDDLMKGVKRDSGKLPKGYAKGSDQAKLYNELKDKISFSDNGNLYKVDLPDEAIAKMLDWDKPLSQQAPEVQKAVSDGMKKYKWPQSTVDDVLKNANGQQALNYLMPSGNRSQASDTLRDFGAPGIRYLDGGSRGAGEGTRNFVVFPGNEGLLKILDRQ